MSSNTWKYEYPSLNIPLGMRVPQVRNPWFSAYPIALIGRFDNQEDAPSSIVPFISCCDSGVSSCNGSLQLFWHFVFSCRMVFCFSCFCYIAGLRGCIRDQVFV